MNDKSALKKAYLQNPPPAGIYQITNKMNGKIFIGKGLNVKGKLNSHLSQLKWGSHMNAALQQDWNTFGADAFVFEVIDLLEAAKHGGSNQDTIDLAGELAELERLWLEKLQPYGEKGYNSPPKDVS